jgi:hypothetical protein
MKTNTKRIGVQWTVLLASAIFTICTSGALAQGTITFNNPWIYDGAIAYKAYNELDMQFRVEAVSPAVPYHNFERWGSLISANGTPFAAFSRYSNHSDFVVINRSSSDAFGLTYVDLINPIVGSQNPYPITFTGYKTDGTTISQTFITPGGMNNFQKFTFNSSFNSGLSRVEIPTATWFMDNLVFVPEPCTSTLFGVGLVLFVMRRRKQIQN